MTDRQLAISAADVRAAALLIAGKVVRTPLLEFPSLNERAGRRVLVKFEGAQYTGSFKFRGAYNRLARLTGENERPALSPGLRATMPRAWLRPPGFWESGPRS